MRSVLIVLSATSLLALVTPVAADPVNGSRGNLGGGFIEFLVTGSSGGARAPQAAPVMSQPRSSMPLPPQAVVAAPQAMPLPEPSARPIAPTATRVSYATPLVSGQGDLVDDPGQQYQAAPGARGPRRDLAPMPSTSGMDPRYERQVVSYNGPHRPGTIVIDTSNRFLYLVQNDGRAMRYGIGVGRPGFEWAGAKTITRKAEWPGWTPPPEMLKRRPDLPRHMVGGPENPLGARAMYLGSSMYRIHGTNEPSTIGQAVSSGCIRLRNEDVTDLYERVHVGMRVIVI